MTICGVELKSNYAILCILEQSDKSYMKTKKIILFDEQKTKDIHLFFEEMNNLLISNNIDKVIIKKRAKKGTFSGGAISFKIEAIFQLNTKCETLFISPQSLASYEKTNDLILPNELKKYQLSAYLCAINGMKMKD